MKKNYFSPETAAMEVQFTSVLCGSGANDAVKEDELENAFPAPKRPRVF